MHVYTCDVCLYDTIYRWKSKDNFQGFFFHSVGYSDVNKVVRLSDMGLYLLSTPLSHEVNSPHLLIKFYFPITRCLFQFNILLVTFNWFVEIKSTPEISVNDLTFEKFSFNVHYLV